MTKRFKAVIDDSWHARWKVVREECGDNGLAEMVYAEFRGNNCRQYACEHARRLNEKEKA